MYIFPVLKTTVGGSFDWKFSVTLLSVLFVSVAVGLFGVSWLPLAWRVLLFVALSASLLIFRKPLMALVTNR